MAARRFSTALPLRAEAVAPPPAAAPRRGRRVFAWAGLAVTATYAGGTLGSLRSDTLRDIFVERFPFAETLVATADEYLDPAPGARPAPARQSAKPLSAIQPASPSANTQQSTPSPASSSTPPPRQPARVASPSRAVNAAPAVERRLPPQSSVQTHQDTSHEVPSAALPAASAVTSLIRSAEEALGIPITSQQQTTAAGEAVGSGGSVKPQREVATIRAESESELTSPEYPGLPLGFEPPQGFSARHEQDPLTSRRPPLPPPHLPQVAPSVTKFAAAEPVLGHLAASIDTLSDFLRGTAQQNARDDLESPAAVLVDAREELQRLGERIFALKQEARDTLQKEMQHRTGEYEARLEEQQRELADKLDAQEEGWKTAFDHERQQIVDQYRDKLTTELHLQQELINERLKEEVIAQGVEMQRRWLQEIKSRVEEERAGRLGHLTDLRKGLRDLESVAIDNASHLDASAQAHALWTALRAAQRAMPSLVELSPALRKLSSTAAEAEIPTIRAVCDAVKTSAQRSEGVLSEAELATAFSTSIVPRVRRAALLPDRGGCLAYFGSALLSPFLAGRDGRFAQGSDVVSVLARAQSHLDRDDVDSAVRECVQLRAWPKILLRDWLQAARAHLEVKQALQYVELEATLRGLQTA